MPWAEREGRSQRAEPFRRNLKKKPKKQKRRTVSSANREDVDIPDREHHLSQGAVPHKAWRRLGTNWGWEDTHLERSIGQQWQRLTGGQIKQGMKTELDF